MLPYHQFDVRCFRIHWRSVERRGTHRLTGGAQGKVSAICDRSRQLLIAAAFSL
ncbi:MAG: hypothetical protein P8010_09160 [Desulfosarcinaceae bacterium]